MKIFGYFLVVLGCLLMFMFAPGTVSAQYPVFIPHDSTNLGIYTKLGMMGAAWGDFNNDGYLDLFQTGNGVRSHLYQNNGGVSFTRVSKDSTNMPGILFDSVGTAYKEGAVFADFDNDGKLDIVWANLGLAMYKNNGYYFDDVTSTAFGTTGIAKGQCIWGITVGDFDNDGYVDIALAGGNQGPNSLAGPVYILHNNKDMTFTDAATALINGSLGLIEAWNPAWVDINNDGFLDLFLPCIRTAPEYCEMLLNDGGGFTPMDTSTVGGSGLNIRSAIASAWGDYNNDGFLDLIVTPFVNDNDGRLKLFRNNGDNTFTNVSVEANIDTNYDGTSRALVWGDVDNDGYLDLLMGSRTLGQRLFHNNGDGTFADISHEVALDTIKGRDERTVFLIDYNSDGFLDYYGSGLNSWKRLLTNSGNGNHWIAFRPVGVTDNKAGIGARFTLVAGGKRQTRVIEGGSIGGCGNGNLWANFGLGPSTTTVDSVIVNWPTGARDVLDKSHHCR